MHGGMKARGRRVDRGRKPNILTEEWANLQLVLPKIMMLALEDYLHDESRKRELSLKKVAFIRDWLERLLVDAGYLEVDEEVDVVGHKTKTYRLKRR